MRIHSLTTPLSFARTKKYLLASLLLPLAAASQVHADDVRIGVVSNGLIVDSVYVAADLAKEQGINVEVTEFSDWVLPNTAVLNKDIDINYFQHEPFLTNAEEERGFDLTPLAYGVEGLMGIYSKEFDKPEDIPAGSTIAVADDPVNQGRGLMLLEQAGLITLPEGIGYHASLYDIEDNPLDLSFVELPGPQLPRAFEDVAAILSYPHYIKSSGVTDPADALLFHRDDTHSFALRFVVHPDNEDNTAIRQFISIYHQAPEVKTSLEEAFGDSSLYQLAWEDFPPLELSE
ncbi:MetQ/NlpA family ABC transporter substrate-binding protein [Halomonas sp. AOP13-D3-9]